MQSDSITVQGNQEIHRLIWGKDIINTHTDRKGIVTASNAGLVVLCHNNVIAISHKALCQQLSYGDQALASLTANHYI
jgi:hypothetical protein